MAWLDLWTTVTRELSDGAGGASDLDREMSEKLQLSIDSLSEAVRDLRQEIAGIRENMRTDFSRLIDRQDSQFRWLAGLIVASAIGVRIAVLKSHG